MFNVIYEDEDVIIDYDKRRKIVRISKFKNEHFVDDYEFDIIDYFGEDNDAT